jgi:hypothetical protein
MKKVLFFIAGILIFTVNSYAEGKKDGYDTLHQSHKP